MASFLPPIPRVFFCYIEPALCLFGAMQPLLDPNTITQLLPAHLSGRPDPDAAPIPLEKLQAGILSTMMLGWSLVTLAIMFLAPKNPRLIHAYVAISAFMDFPHWGSFVVALGSDGLAQWRTFPGAMWAQILVPAFTFSIKVGYLSGVFGADRVEGKGKKRK